MAALRDLEALGNFKDDAGGVVGKAPSCSISGGGIYLVGLVRPSLLVSANPPPFPAARAMVTERLSGWLRRSAAASTTRAW